MCCLLSVYQGCDPFAQTQRSKLQHRRARINQQINKEMRMRAGAENLFRWGGVRRLLFLYTALLWWSTKSVVVVVQFIVVCKVNTTDRAMHGDICQQHRCPSTCFCCLVFFSINSSPECLFLWHHQQQWGRPFVRGDALSSASPLRRSDGCYSGLLSVLAALC